MSNFRPYLNYLISHILTQQLLFLPHLLGGGLDHSSSISIDGIQSPHTLPLQSSRQSGQKVTYLSVCLAGNLSLLT